MPTPAETRVAREAARRIRRFRELAGLTQAELAALHGWSQAVVSQMETDDLNQQRRPSLERAVPYMEWVAKTTRAKRISIQNRPTYRDLLALWGKRSG